jgi:hypothetical protein
VLNTIVVIVAVLVIGVVGVLGFAATKPDAFRVQRAANINAPPEKIFALIDDFQRWNAWSPYEKKDPAMKRTFSGAAKGKGAVYAFAGNSQVGAGRLEIIDTTAPSKVALTLDMIKPFAGHNIIEFTLQPKGGATDVTWAMHGAMPYISKVMSVFFNMDRMIGNDFEIGLANLKTLTE